MLPQIDGAMLLSAGCTGYGEECQHWYREDDKCPAMAAPHGEHCEHHGGDAELRDFTAEHEMDDCCPVHHDEGETVHLVDGRYPEEARAPDRCSCCDRAGLFLDCTDCYECRGDPCE